MTHARSQDAQPALAAAFNQDGLATYRSFWPSRHTRRLAGPPVIAFFGFTFCPDVCPTTLINITGWLERLGSDAEEMAVALISVDPERDTPAVLAAFLANFTPRIIGYTGSASAISQTADAFRVHYENVISGQGDYTVNHSAGVFLFYPDGRFGSIIDFHEDSRFAVPKIRRILPLFRS